jgi:Domain of unknown function (DUF4157)
MEKQQMPATAKTTPQSGMSHASPSTAAETPGLLVQRQAKYHEVAQAAQRRVLEQGALGSSRMTARDAAYLQLKEAGSSSAPSPKAPENKTGMPDNLKSGIERLSGLPMDDVTVHYNSSKPAQLQAHAYAQGTDIHMAPGQEKHLAHEAWHVVQQKQGRVKPTTQMKGTVPVNDDAGLEQEADVMGAKAMAPPSQMQAENGVLQGKSKTQPASGRESGMLNGENSSFQFVDNRPEAIAQRKQQAAINSPQVRQMNSFQEAANSGPRVQQLMASSSRTTQLEAASSQKGAPASQNQPVVQRIPTKEEFKERTTFFFAPRKEIKKIDGLLATFHSIKLENESSIENRLKCITLIIEACNEYLDLPEKHKRKPGVRKLLEQAKEEQLIYKHLSQIPALNLSGTQLEQLFLEYLKVGHMADLASSHGVDNIPELYDYIIAMRELIVNTGMKDNQLKNVDSLFNKRLKTISKDESAPDTTRKVLRELHSITDKVEFNPGRGGMFLTPGLNPTKKYRGGFQFDENIAGLMGQWVHELTHANAYEVYENTEILLLHSKETTTGELDTLIRKRLNNTQSLLQSVKEDKSLPPALKDTLIRQLNYAMADKLNEYLTRRRNGLKSFKEILENPKNSRELILDTEFKINALKESIETGENIESENSDIVKVSSLLVEYESVINQLLLIMHYWDIPQENISYKTLIKCAEEAYQDREKVRKAKNEKK